MIKSQPPEMQAYVTSRCKQMGWGGGRPLWPKAGSTAPQEEASSLFREKAAQKAFVAFSPFLLPSNLDWDFCGAGADTASIFYLFYDNSTGGVYN